MMTLSQWDLPDNIKKRFPTQQAFIEALNFGIVVRDAYGNFVVAGDPPLTDTVCWPKNYGYKGSTNTK